MADMILRQVLLGLSLLVLCAATVHAVPNRNGGGQQMTRKEPALHRRMGLALRTCTPSYGRWVMNNAKPRYTPTSCKLLQTLAGSTSCLKWRKNLKYLTYTWVPNGCATGKFDPAYFLKKMAGKVIAFAGDSIMTSDFFPSIICQVSAVTPLVEDAGWSKALGATAYWAPKYKTVFVNYWSIFLVASSTNSWYLGRINRGQNYSLAKGDTAVNLDRMDPVYGDHLEQFDLLVMTSMVHWPRASGWNRRYFTSFKWRLLKPQPDVYEAFSKGMQAVLKRLSPAPGFKLPSAYFLSASPRQQYCEKSQGVPTPTSQYQTLLAQNPQSKNWFPVQQKVFGQPGSPVKFLDVTKLSLLRADAMVGSADVPPGDCLHPCVPGLPDTWVDVFYLNWLNDPRFK